MKIIHISDFHLDSEELDLQHKRVLGALLNDLKNYEIEEETILVFSGDFLNFGGKNFKNKKEAFFKFREIVFDELTKNFPSLKGRIFFVPGNHDIDREILKRKDIALKKDILNNETDRNEIYKELKDDSLTGFEEFIRFQSEFYEDFPEDSKCITNIESNFKIKIGENNIGISSLNGSIFCYNDEDYGNLILFEEQLSNSYRFISECDVKIAILHQPLDFFHKSEVDKIREIIEKEYDILLLGHTHKQESSFHQTLNGNCYFSVAKSLNGKMSKDMDYINGYSIMEYIPNEELKVNLRKYCSISYKFIPNSDYGKEDGIQIISINKNLENSDAKNLTINANFKKFLKDVGANLTHKNKSKIELDDIYIYPNLDIYDVSSEEKRNTINSLEIFNDIRDKDISRIVILGENSSGKTSFCKKAFGNIFNIDEFYPIFINGEDIKSTDIKKLEKLKNIALNEQYESEKIPPYKKPFFIFDNFNDTSLEPKYKRKFLENIIQNDISFILIWDEFFTFNEVFDSMVSQLNIYEILPLGRKYRFELIEKWMNFTDYNTEQEKVAFTYDVEKLINSVIGKNLVPSYPLYILTLLQSTELLPSESFEQSTLGHYYDALIRMDFSKFLKRNSDIEKYYSYLSELAYVFFQQEEKSMDESALMNFHTRFVKDYNIQGNGFIDMEKNLTRCEILNKSNGKYKFKYNYVYYYFLGKYLADNVENDIVKEYIKGLANSLYITASANTYLFLSHHSKSEFVTQTIIETAKGLFEKEPILDFSSDISKINDLISRVSHNITLDISKSYRENKISDLEETEKIDTPKLDKEIVEKEEDINIINYISDINKSFKTIEILGLILKNRYASLKAEPKLEIAQQVYFLGLRTTSTIFKTLLEGEEILKNDLIKIIGEERTLSRFEKEELAKKIMFNMYYVTAYTIIKRISNSIATKDLEPTFNDIRDKFPQNNAVSLIDISNKLEYSANFPFSDVDSLVSKLKTNKFPFFLLRRLSLNYLRMFPMKDTDKQKICSKLEIPINVQRQIEMQSKVRKR